MSEPTAVTPDQCTCDKSYAKHGDDLCLCATAQKSVAVRLLELATDLRWRRDLAIIEARSCASDDKVTRAMLARNARRLNWRRLQHHD